MIVPRVTDFKGMVSSGKGVQLRQWKPGLGFALFLMCSVFLSSVLLSVPAKTAGGDTLPGAAAQTPGAGEGCLPSPCAADIDGDGREEIICGDGGSVMRCLNPDGGVRWAVDTGSHISSSAAARDVNGDGLMEIFFGDDAAYLWGLDCNGRALGEWGWPRYLPPARACEKPDALSSPSIGDIDGDGDMEIVTATWGMCIWAFHYQGPVCTGFPIDVKDSVWSSPAIADINRDGLNEIIIGADCTAGPGWPYPSGGLVFVIDGWGRNLPGWPKSTPQVIWSAPAIADLDNDGYLDIIVGTGHFYQNVDGCHVYAWDPWGNDLPGWPADTNGYVFSSPAVGDVNGDGELEVVAGDITSTRFVFSSTGQVLETGSATGLSSAVLGDIDGDGKIDAYNPNHQGAAAIGDFDRDGKVEIADYRGITQTEARYNRDLFPWPMFRHDCHHSGCYGAPTVTPLRPTKYETYVLLQNPSGARASVDVNYMTENGTSSESVVVEPYSRRTVFVNESAGIGLNVSTEVSSDTPIIAERAMYFDSEGRTGGHDSIGTPEPSRRWYLPEGYTAEQYDTWVLVQNPGNQQAGVNLTFMRSDGGTSDVNFEMSPRSRHSVHVDEVPGLESCEVSTRINASTPVIAERSMYFDYNGITGGHDSIGITEPAETWYLAEGCTGWGFDTYVLVQNTDDDPVEVEYTFMKDDRQNIEYTRTVPAHSRYTVKVDDIPGLEGCSFSTFVRGSAPVCCERAMYFDNGGRAGGHDSIGTTSPSDTWFFAEGYTGESYDTWVLLQNPSDETVTVRATFMTPQGRPVERDYPVGPRSRFSISIDSIPGLGSTEVSTSLESADGAGFIAERAVYFVHKGIWPGGHETVGVKAPSRTWFFAEGYTGD
jgi:hypothetical protein